MLGTTSLAHSHDPLTFVANTSSKSCSEIVSMWPKRPIPAEATTAHRAGEGGGFGGGGEGLVSFFGQGSLE